MSLRVQLLIKIRMTVTFTIPTLFWWDHFGSQHSVAIKGLKFLRNARFIYISHILQRQITVLLSKQTKLKLWKKTEEKCILYFQQQFTLYLRIYGRLYIRISNDISEINLRPFIATACWDLKWFHQNYNSVCHPNFDNCPFSDIR